MISHISVGKMSDLEAAHCPSYKYQHGSKNAIPQLTLMKAGPALSIDLTRNQYHHNVPLLSPPLFEFLFPTQIAGTLTRTGTKITTKCRNRSPVHIGSQIYRSTNTITWSLNRRKPRTSPLTSFFISSRDACSIRPSAVCSVPSLSFSDIWTKASGLNPAAVAKSKPLRLWGDFQYHFPPVEFHLRTTLWKCDCRSRGLARGSCCRRHIRPMPQSHCIIP
jgi:hypothetical protein